MRILIVIDANDGRGLFRHAYNLSKHIAKIGHHVAVAYVDHDEGVIVEDGIKIYKFAGYVQGAAFLYAQRDVRHHGPIPDGLAIMKIEKIIEAEKPDLIHAHGWVLYSIASLKKKISIPIITTLHDYGFLCPTKMLLRNNKVLCRDDRSLWTCLKCSTHHYGSLKSALTLYGVRKYFNLLRSSVDCYLAVSTYVKERYAAAGFPEERLIVIPNFYTEYRWNEQQQQQPPTVQLPDDFVLFVGSLTDTKGVNILIRAFKNINTDTKLVMIGFRYPDFHYHSDNNIIILENQTHDIVMEAWKRCRFGIVPSICPDCCPTVALEAMACKKALVASKIGGLSDIVIHGKTGYLYPPYDEEALIYCMKDLLENKTLAEEMGQRGFQRVNNCFTVDRVIGDIQDVYQNVLSMVK